VTVFDCSLDPHALALQSRVSSDDRRAVAELRRRGLVIDELRKNHAAEVARLRNEMQAEKEASLLELVRLHAEREKLLESLALLEFKLNSTHRGGGEEARAEEGDDRESSQFASAGRLRASDNGGRMEVSTVSSGLPPAVGLGYWMAYAGEEARQRAALR
jgi:hypothetical protein